MILLPKDSKILLDYIKASKYKPNPKEKSFFKSVKYAIESDQRLTDGQSKWLQGIYAKTQGGGDHQLRQFLG